jgi:hypothetical protein
MRTGPEDLEDLPPLISEVVALCSQMQTAMAQQPKKSAAMGR